MLVPRGQNILIGGPEAFVSTIRDGVPDAGRRVASGGSQDDLEALVSEGGFGVLFVDAGLDRLDIPRLRGAAPPGAAPPIVVLVGGCPDATAIARGAPDAPDDVLPDRPGRTEVTRRLAVVDRAAARSHGAGWTLRIRDARGGGDDAVLMLSAAENPAGADDVRIAEVQPEGATVFGLAYGELVGASLADVLPRPEEGSGDSGGWIARAIRFGRCAEREVPIDDPGRPGRRLRLIVTPVNGGALLSVRDITDRRRSDDDEGARRRLAMLVASRDESARVFQQAAGEAVRLLDGASGAVLQGDGDLLRTVGSWAVPGEEPRRIGSTVERDSEAAPARGARLQVPSRHGEGGRRASVTAPIWVGGEVWGVIVVERARILTDGAEERLARLADLVSLSIANTEDRDALVAEASTDPVAGIANRRVFHERLSAEVSRSLRIGTRLSLMVVDLDYFKSINDRWGHPVGDAVLSEFAALLETLAREEDTVARLGGDEFGWILPHAAGADAVAVGERLQRAVAAHDFTEVGSLTLSIGIAEGGGGWDAAALFRAADSALYDSKLGGRNRLVEHRIVPGEDRSAAPVVSIRPGPPPRNPVNGEPS